MAGGGAAAAFEVGVLLQLDSRNIKVDSIYGTSGGALNAACYAYAGSMRLDKMWRSIGSWRDLWSLNLTTLVGFGSGAMNSKPLRKKINRICKGTPKLRCCVTKVDLTNGDLVYSYAGDDDFHESVEASAAIPGIIQPVGGIYGDGGIREVCPLKKAVDDGHDQITVILCDPSNRIDQWTVKDGFLGFLDCALRANSIRGAEVLKDDISSVVSGNRATVEVFEPERELLGFLDFKKELISEAIEAGFTTNGKFFGR
jgi:NTE family protein